LINRHPIAIIKLINHLSERVKMKKEKEKEKENPQRHKAYSYVRFSTTDQKKGDSLDRQTEKTLKYIKEHNLELDTTLNLLDAGVSAFKGKNVDEGMPEVTAPRKCYWMQI
jgi:predicted site-specific integrase-resolvase